MKKDIVHIHSAKGRNINNYELEKHWYMGTISIIGSTTKQILTELLKQYKNWNLIEWRIPAISNCVITQKLAIDNGFIPVGYDPGSYQSKGTLFDSILFAYFPNGVILNQFDKLQTTKKNQELSVQVINSLKFYANSFYAFKFHPPPASSV